MIGGEGEVEKRQGGKPGGKVHANIFIGLGLVAYQQHEIKKKKKKKKSTLR
eukprot:NODE_30713_length_412_cov_0.726316.p3 GENE.NODE_30713_length_412_cov_0.726316~~NODE_30713_length_412_cov_0.726316.p3  ORF type:complete len:51 (+),score=12.54 NODE_30713_length_412_cov_0.726316:258-410(+)